MFLQIYLYYLFVPVDEVGGVVDVLATFEIEALPGIVAILEVFDLDGAGLALVHGLEDVASRILSSPRSVAEMVLHNSLIPVRHLRKTIRCGFDEGEASSSAGAVERAAIATESVAVVFCPAFDEVLDFVVDLDGFFSIHDNFLRKG